MSFNIFTCFCLCKIDPGFLLFAGLGHIEGAGSTVLFNLWQAIAVFIETTSPFDRQSLRRSELLFRNIIKRARGICTMKIKTGSVKFGPPWSIIALHPGNVRHDAPVWSQILSSLIFFKEMTATKNSCSFDDFPVAKSSIKQRITAL